MSAAESDEPLPSSYFLAEWKRLGLIPSDSEPRVCVSEAITTAEAVKTQRMASFKEFCPAQFRAQIDRTKIPNLTAWDAADAWLGSHPGVWLWSHDTGEAKSRMLWRKFGQLHVEQGRTVARITGANLAEEYHDAFNHSSTGAFYRRFKQYDCIMLDDLDKIPLPRQGVGFAEHDQAERNARMLRELFDRFYENLTPVLVTANESITWFGLRIGASAERRMREVCNEIPF